MKWNFKKKLSFLSVLSLSTVTSSFVTSCGMTVKDIDNRIIGDADTYTYFLKKNMQFPTTYLSQSSVDFNIYADAFATIITYDQYGRLQGNLAERRATKEDTENAKDVKAGTAEENANSNYVGLHNSDFSFWQYKFRDASWVDSKGKKQDKLTAGDFLNTCKSILYTPLGANVTSLITQFIANSSEINEYFKQDDSNNFYQTAHIYKYDSVQKNGCPYKIFLTDPTDDEKSGLKFVEDLKPFDGKDWKNNKIWNYLGVWLGSADQDSNKYSDTVDDETVNIALTGSYDYFESVLSYAAFAPISEHFMDIDSSVTISSDLFLNKMWYSGAYYIDSYKTSQYVRLTKNDYFYWADKTNIKRINWMITPTMTSTSDQEYFESGITSQFSIYSSNLNAWKKYIGEDYSKPTSSAITEMYDTNYPASWGIYFDYAFNAEKCIGTEAQAVDSQTANLLSISDIVRAYISTNINRSTYVEGYCSLYDESNNNGKTLNTASWVTNTLTADDLSSDTSDNKTDYTRYVQKEYENIKAGGGYRSDNSSVESTNGKAVATYTAGDTTSNPPTDAAKGQDAFYQTNSLLSNLYDINGNKIKDQAGLLSAVKAYVQDGVKKGTMKLGSDGKAQMVWLAQTNLRPYRYLKAMLEDFNSLEGNPLEIIVDGTADADQYNTSIENFGTSFEMWGWSPDYADPSTYLNTFSLGGDMSGYIGLPDIFTNATSTSSVASTLSSITLSNSSDDVSGNNVHYQNSSALSDKFISKENVDKIESALGLSDNYSYLKDSYYWNKFVMQNVEYSNSVTLSNRGGNGDAEGNSDVFGSYKIDSSDDSKYYSDVKYNAYAVTEANATMQDFLWTPMFRYAKYTPALSYLAPFQTPEALFGTSFGTHWNTSLVPNLIKKNEFDEIKSDYLKKVEIAKQPNKLRDVVDWDNSGAI